MVFWKKSKDPWDTVPEKKEAVNSFQQYVDQWNATLEREKAEKEAAEKAREDYENAPWSPADAMDCPWCGRAMDKAYVYGRSGVVWQQAPPTGIADIMLGAWPLGRDSDAWWGYKRAWYCPDCQRMALDVKKPYEYRRIPKQEDAHGLLEKE